MRTTNAFARLAAALFRLSAIFIALAVASGSTADTPGESLPATGLFAKTNLVALNLNGMVRHGDKVGKLILLLGQGDLDLKLLRIINVSGWRGPIGILNHTDEDAEGRLRDNLDGLAWLVLQLEGKPAGQRPVPRTGR